MNIISTKIVSFCQNEVVTQGSASATNAHQYCRFMGPWRHSNTTSWSSTTKISSPFLQTTTWNNELKNSTLN